AAGTCPEFRRPCRLVVEGPGTGPEFATGIIVLVLLALAEDPGGRPVFRTARGRTRRRGAGAREQPQPGGVVFPVDLACRGLPPEGVVGVGAIGPDVFFCPAFVRVFPLEEDCRRPVGALVQVGPVCLQLLAGEVLQEFSGGGGAERPRRL